MLGEVVDEVGLGLQLPLYLIGLDEAETAMVRAAVNLEGIHVKIRMLWIKIRRVFIM